MNEVERVREQIAITLCKQRTDTDKWGDIERDSRLPIFRHYADQILSLEGIAVLDDDQSLPEIKTGEWCNRGCHEIEQDNMRKAGFKKMVSYW